VIILEDFQDHQFALKDRKVGLGLDHSKMVLAKLAKFHAASAVQYEYQEGIFTDELVKKFPPMAKDSPYYQSMENILNTFRRKVTSWPGYDHYKEIFEKWDVSKVISILTEIAEPTKSGFVVLNHGNLWMNNLLYRENKDEASDVTFIDFQSSFWGSPAYDFL
jgi:thiamine kinase-like enzyme